MFVKFLQYTAPFPYSVDCSHHHIYMRWLEDLNIQSAHLIFVSNGEKIWAAHASGAMDREIFEHVVSAVKVECIGAARNLLWELQGRFPSHGVMDALGVVYLQFWLHLEAEECFPKQLEILVNFYCEPKLIEMDKVKSLVPHVLDTHKLQSDQGLFKLAMLNNSKKQMGPPFDVNPLTCLWKILDSSTVLRVKSFPEFYKLAKIVIVQVLGSVEDERCFNSLSFLKNKLRNSLNTHLQYVVGMYSQKIFSLENFPYEDAYNQGTVAIDCQYGL